MNNLKITDKKTIYTVENISNTCACSEYKCSQSCAGDDTVYEASANIYLGSIRSSSRGVEPW